MTFEIRLKTAVLAQVHLISLIDEAARTERFLSKPRPPRAASMYDLLSVSYEKGDWSYYEKALMKLRATPRQVTRWEFAIDALMAIEEDISKDPLLDKSIVWMKANRFNWTQVGKYFGFSRHQIKNRYTNLLSRLCNKIKNNKNKYCKLKQLLYLI